MHFVLIFKCIENDSNFLEWIKETFQNIHHHVFQQSTTFIIVNSTYSYATYTNTELLVKTCQSEQDAFYECLCFGDIEPRHIPSFDKSFENYRADHFCAICMEPRRESGVQLPCKHTYCRVCISKLTESHNEFRCPTCRTPTRVPRIYLAGPAGAHVLPQTRLHERYIFVGPNMISLVDEDPDDPEIDRYGSLRDYCKGCHMDCECAPIQLAHSIIGHHTVSCRCISRVGIAKAAMMQIESADYVYAKITRPDAFGTIAEIGYAVAKGIAVYVELSEGLTANDRKELWFVKEMARVTHLKEDPDDYDMLPEGLRDLIDTSMPIS